MKQFLLGLVITLPCFCFGQVPQPLAPPSATAECDVLVSNQAMADLADRKTDFLQRAGYSDFQIQSLVMGQTVKTTPGVIDQTYIVGVTVFLQKGTVNLAQNWELTYDSPYMCSDLQLNNINFKPDLAVGP